MRWAAWENYRQDKSSWACRLGRLIRKGSFILNIIRVNLPSLRGLVNVLKALISYTQVKREKSTSISGN